MFNGILFNQDLPRHKRARPLFEKLERRPSERENCSVEEYCGWTPIVNGLTEWRYGQCRYKPEVGDVVRLLTPGQWANGKAHGCPERIGDVGRIYGFTNHRGEAAAEVDGAYWPVRAIEIIKEGGR